VRKYINGAIVVGLSMAAVTSLMLVGMPAVGHVGTYRAPRTADGRPDINGIWQAVTTANWDIQDHPARPGPPQFGALFAAPAGQGVVVGNEIPYRPDALEKKKANFANRFTADPEAKCYMPGIPRATYMPFPFQVVQGTDRIMMVYEFAGANRTIHMDKADASPVDSWMGHSVGRWDGNTLVVDVTSQVDQTWFDRAGNFHSDALRVVERFTRTGADHMQYDVTISDPKVFTRDWKMSMPLYRRIERDAVRLEFKCVEFSEELLYGHLRKRAGGS
jgi:hypothetical protein